MRVTASSHPATFECLEAISAWCRTQGSCGRGQGPRGGQSTTWGVLAGNGGAHAAERVLKAAGDQARFGFDSSLMRTT